jgi:hypothetical protein
LTLSPDRIEITTIYDGALVQVEGDAEPGSQMVVVVRGPDKEEEFNKKVRAGPIWINSGKVHVSGVPALFLSFSPEPVRDILPPETVEEYVLDAQAIKGHMHLDAEGDPIDEDLMADNYLTLKVEGDIYQLHDDTESLALGAGASRFSMELPWPRTAPPADYEVAAYECRDGEVTRTSRTTLTVEKVGVPQRVFDFAMNEASKYGLLAVLIAMCAGFGIDFIVSRTFGAKPKGGH